MSSTIRRWSLLAVAASSLAATYWMSRLDRPFSTTVGQALTTPARGAVVAAQPRAVVDEATFDLGVLIPGDHRKHAFVVRNTGAADLLLKLGSTTCKCTMARFDEIRIAPGRSDVVELEWRAEYPQFHFRQGAIINTNDPLLPQFELVGEGSVRVKLGTIPEFAHLADVPRNTSRSLSVLLYSQAFADVEILGVESSSDSISAEITAVTSHVAPPQESRFLRDLTIHLQPQAKAGRIDGNVRVRYVARASDGGDESGVCELPVSFDVVGDVTLHGRDVVGNVLSFGTVSQSTGATKQVYLHLRGGRELDDVQLTVRRKYPEVLNVDIGESRRLTPSILRVPITVEIPRGAPMQAFTEESLGAVELSTTLADQPVVRFSTSLVVVP